HPVEAVALLPDLWLIPVGAAIGVAIFFGAQPHLTPALAFMHRVLASDAARLGAVLVVASIQGLVFLVMVPPWEHPDETAHFEYAWLLAFHPSWPVPGTVNPAISWLSGGRALSHPPTYHLLVSLPLRATANFDILSQLYIARSVSLLLFVATVAIIGAIVRVITPAGHVLRWLAPLVAALLPSFADAMTAVNNDVGAVTAFSLFLWGATTLIVQGPSIYRLIWIIVAAALAAAMKNTAFISIGLAPLVCIAAYALHYKWHWRTLLTRAVVVVGMLCAAGAPGILAWGDPAGWYRYGEVSPDGAARTRADLAIDGHYVFRLVVASPSLQTGLSVPIPHHYIPALAGKPVTVGAWVWASRPARIAGPGVLYARSEAILSAQQDTPFIDVDTTPRFFAWTFHTPRALTSLQVFLPALLSDDGPSPIEVFVDDVLLVPGERLPSSPIKGFQSDWKEWHADNLVRNPSAEEAWLYLRPWAERAGRPLIRQSPSQILTSLFDLGRVVSIGLPAIPNAFWRLFASFGQHGNVVFPYQGWVVVVPVLPVIVLFGCVRQYRSLRRDRQRDAAIGLLAVAGLLVWGFAVMRTLPTLVALLPFFPRYGFPAIAPLALVLSAGWLAWWPAHRRSTGAAALVVALLMLNALAYATMWWHWYA
ncbi:MAG: hypothetical protein NZ701_00395, partial [Roseiflexus sp.]|nr:hypothetical protein [Roseiflexus sp.]